GDDLVLAHPYGEHGGTDAATALTITGGAAVFVFGMAVFKRSIGGPWLITHLVGIVGFVVVFALAASTALVTQVSASGVSTPARA
ncbi:hypothetical protein ACC691_40025, partial [Rhizobium johnstonii]